MFSGTGNDSRFRIADYRFIHDPGDGSLKQVVPSEPMRLCPEIRHDLNTPFISKDGRYVAAYTADTAAMTYTPGASLKIFEITSVDPRARTTSCRPVTDLGFAAGKADFSFDGSMLTFHTSQGGYLTPFVNGGLPATTITDVAVARLVRDAAGNIVGHRGLQRLTTSLTGGVGSYFPAFFPDGSLFFIANTTPRDHEGEKRFHFRVMDPRGGRWTEAPFVTPEMDEAWQALAAHWEQSCGSRVTSLAEAPFPLQVHEAPWLALALDERQCRALVHDARAASAVGDDGADKPDLCRPAAP